MTHVCPTVMMQPIIFVLTKKKHLKKTLTLLPCTYSARTLQAATVFNQVTMTIGLKGKFTLTQPTLKHLHTAVSRPLDRTRIGWLTVPWAVDWPVLVNLTQSPLGSGNLFHQTGL